MKKNCASSWLFTKISSATLNYCFIFYGNSSSNSVVRTEYGLSNWWSGFELGVVHVGTVKENVTLKLVVLRVLLLSVASTSLPMLQTYLNLQTGKTVVCTIEVMFFWKSENIRENVIGVHFFW